MLFRSDDKKRIREGSLTSTFRKWKSPRAKIGGRYNLHPVGAIEVCSVERCTIGSASAKAVKAAGYLSKDDLATSLKCAPGDMVYYVTFRYLGPQLVNQPAKNMLGKRELDEMIERLRKMDLRSKQGAWTTLLLQLIKSNPATRAGDLAQEIGWQTQTLKAHVRRLKKLGLTISLVVGYELSTRGKQVFKRLKNQ